MPEVQKSKFGTEYYKSKYRAYICKLQPNEAKELEKILKKNDLGFTELIKFIIKYYKDKNIEMEYKIK